MRLINELFVRKSLALIKENPLIKPEKNLGSLIRKTVRYITEDHPSNDPLVPPTDPLIERTLQSIYPHATEAYALASFVNYAAFLNDKTPSQIPFQVFKDEETQPKDEVEAIFLHLWRVRHAVTKDFHPKISGYQAFILAMALQATLGPLRQDTSLAIDQYWLVANLLMKKLNNTLIPPELENYQRWKAQYWEMLRITNMIQGEPAPESIPLAYQPIHTAACRGNVEELQALIQQGAHPNAPAEAGLTPLHLAAGNGKLEVCKTLVKQYKCDPGNPSNEGLTPLHLAAKNGHHSVATYLLSFPSVSAIQRTVDGDTPLDLMMRHFDPPGQGQRVSEKKREEQYESRLIIATALTQRRF